MHSPLSSLSSSFCDNTTSKIDRCMMFTLFFLSYLWLVLSSVVQLCPNMQNSGDTWYCCACGDDYRTWPFIDGPNDACWVQPGVNPDGCNLPFDAYHWLCCRNCHVTCSDLCAPSSTGIGGGTGNNGNPSSGTLCLGRPDCNCMGGTVGQFCMLTFLLFTIFLIGCCVCIISIGVFYVRRYNSRHEFKLIQYVVVSSI